MKVTLIPEDELPPEVRAATEEMVKANAEEIARFREALRCPHTSADETVAERPPSNGIGPRSE